MSIDPRLLADVKGAESCRLVAYLDTKGNWTIGWGHKLQSGPDWSGTLWSQSQADEQLATDLTEALTDCQTLAEFTASPVPVRNAIAELVFNLGRPKWLEFTVCRRALSTGNPYGAMLALLDSDWAEQVGPYRALRLAMVLWTRKYS